MKEKFNPSVRDRCFDNSGRRTLEFAAPATVAVMGTRLSRGDIFPSKWCLNTEGWRLSCVCQRESDRPTRPPALKTCKQRSAQSSACVFSVRTVKKGMRRMRCT